MSAARADWASIVCTSMLARVVAGEGTPAWVLAGEGTLARVLAGEGTLARVVAGEESGG